MKLARFGISVFFCGMLLVSVNSTHAEEPVPTLSFEAAILPEPEVPGEFDINGDGLSGAERFQIRISDFHTGDIIYDSEGIEPLEFPGDDPNFSVEDFGNGLYNITLPEIANDVNSFTEISFTAEGNDYTRDMYSQEFSGYGNPQEPAGTIVSGVTVLATNVAKNPAKGKCSGKTITTSIPDTKGVNKDSSSWNTNSSKNAANIKLQQLLAAHGISSGSQCNYTPPSPSGQVCRVYNAVLSTPAPAAGQSRNAASGYKKVTKTTGHGGYKTFVWRYSTKNNNTEGEAVNVSVLTYCKFQAS